MLPSQVASDYKIKKVIVNDKRDKLIVVMDIIAFNRKFEEWFYIDINGKIDDDIEKTEWVCKAIYLKDYNYTQNQNIKLTKETKKEILDVIKCEKKQE